MELGRRLTTEVLAPMKQAFVGKDEIIDLMGVCLAGGENLFILGPPGTAKSALVHNLSQRLHGESFDYLLTRFTEPNELFGPFDIRKLREGELVTNTEGMLPEAYLVFLDELLNANSAILNSLLMALNERVFRRGRETRPLKALMFVGASNHLPEEDALQALFDRFLLRVHCDNVSADSLGHVLEAGWKLQRREATSASLGFEQIKQLQGALNLVDVTTIRTQYLEVLQRIRRAGIPVSDRRAVKLQRLLAASALLCGRREVLVSDMWVLKFIWDTETQQEVLKGIIDQALSRSEPNDADHPRSRASGEPDPEALARDLAALEEQFTKEGSEPAAKTAIRDRLTVLEGRVQWVKAAEKRQQLTTGIQAFWQKLGTETPVTG